MSLITSFCLLLFDRRLESHLNHIQGRLCWKSSKLGKQFKASLMSSFELLKLTVIIDYASHSKLLIQFRVAAFCRELIWVYIWVDLGNWTGKATQG
jgi:hypothetical protein